MASPAGIRRLRAPSSGRASRLPIRAIVPRFPVSWHVALTPGGKPVESGQAEARPARDFTVKAEPRKLKPGQDYVYWFDLADGTRSPVGRFRTLPKGKTPDLTLAVVTCQLYGGGFYNAYNSIARLDRLDAVVHLGDYIYEYASDGYGGEISSKIGRTVQPPHEIVTLADYRLRHASYKTDPMLQAAHARAAFICVWDDHETANDSWMHGAENHQPDKEGDWNTRKAAAMQAYFEWMPIRDPVPGKPWDAINRSFAFGDLATLFMVETRLLARSEQAGFKGATPTGAAIAGILAERQKPERELLGEPQRKWLEDGLTTSVKAGTPWQILGNQVVMARVEGPDLVKQLGAERAAEMLASLSPAMRQQVEAAQAGYRAGLPFNLDAWDGYVPARERLYASFRRAGFQAAGAGRRQPCLLGEQSRRCARAAGRRRVRHGRHHQPVDRRFAAAGPARRVAGASKPRSGLLRPARQGLYPASPHAGAGRGGLCRHGDHLCAERWREAPCPLFGQGRRGRSGEDVT